ncbi:DUF6089 family protein [Cytophagaceae bacterium ABcell3]|nr:DUF6089 family protein [Cytophagaceae bacterium ABcell3]
MKKSLQIATLFTGVFLLSFSSSAQTLRDTWRNIQRDERLSVLGSLGLSAYFGDVCESFDCMQLRPNAGIGAIFRITNHFSSKTEANYFRLYSDDTHESRNLGFRSDNVELYTSVMFDLFAYQKNIRLRNVVSPYLFAGFGVAFYNPQAQYNGRWFNLRPLETEGERYSIATPIIPFGGGVRFTINRNFEFMLEGAYRVTFTDHLDDVSSVEHRPIESFSDPLARNIAHRYKDNYNPENGQRGNPDRNDGYFLLQAKIRYTFVRQLSTYGTRPPGLRRKL